MSGVGFPEEVTPGGVLVYPSVRSPNFIHSISGWTINVDGSAEFNNLTIRGTFNGTNFIINTSGIFFYSSTPANGNLAASIAPASGTDGFGNSYVSGFAAYSNGIQTIINQAGLILTWIAGAGGTSAPAPQQPGNVQVGIPLNNSAQPNLAIQGPTANADLVVPMILLQGKSQNGTMTPNAFIKNSDGSALPVGFSGPISVANETWHAMPAFTTGWSAGVPAPEYRLMPDNSVQLQGVVNIPASGSYNSITFVTLPAGYRPNVSQRIPVSHDAVGGYNGDPHLFVDTSGNLQVAGYPTSANSTHLFLGGVRFPLDS